MDWLNVRGIGQLLILEFKLIAIIQMQLLQNHKFSLWQFH